MKHFRTLNKWWRENWRNWLPTIINTIGALVFGLIGLILTAVCGAGFISIVFGLIGVIAWFAIYVGWGLRKIRGPNFMVIERLGQYHQTAKAGLVCLCLPPYIDRPAPNGGEYDFEYHGIDILPTPEEQIDFKDGGTGSLVGKITYRVALPDDDKNIGDDGPCRWTYVSKDTEGQILSLILGLLKQQAQTMTVEEACADLDGLSTKGQDSDIVKTALAGMGVILRPQNGVVIRDIRLSPEVLAARQRVQDAEERILEAAKRTEEAKALVEQQGNVGKGYSAAIKGILEDLKSQNPEATLEMAIQIYQTAEGMKVLKDKGGDLTFVSPDIGKTVTSIIVEPRHHGTTPPSNPTI